MCFIEEPFPYHINLPYGYKPETNRATNKRKCSALGGSDSYCVYAFTNKASQLILVFKCRRWVCKNKQQWFIKVSILAIYSKSILKCYFNSLWHITFTIERVCIQQIIFVFRMTWPFHIEPWGESNIRECKRTEDLTARALKFTKKVRWFNGILPRHFLLHFHTPHLATIMYI